MLFRVSPQRLLKKEKFLGLCIGAQHRYNIYREVGAADMPIFPRYISGEISVAERSEAAEPKTAPGW